MLENRLLETIIYTNLTTSNDKSSKDKKQHKSLKALSTLLKHFFLLSKDLCLTFCRRRVKGFLPISQLTDSSQRTSGRYMKAQYVLGQKDLSYYLAFINLIPSWLIYSVLGRT